MTPIITSSKQTSINVDNSIDILFNKLNEAIDDLENGRIQPLEEAWEEIDAI